jgi:peptidoglycan/xylan/chitin deacetylase (PgdA/CDA1 family)
MKNGLSIDIETWAYGDTPDMRRLTSRERKALDAGYVLESARQVLAMLREAGAHITLFVIGEQLEWYPQLGEMIVADGHELGLHAFRHYRIDTLDALRADLDQAMPQVRRFGIRGYRAPLIYLPQGGMEVLAEYGFTSTRPFTGRFHWPVPMRGCAKCRFRRWRAADAKPYGVASSSGFRHDSADG